jgi:hypothetical protein
MFCFATDCERKWIAFSDTNNDAAINYLGTANISAPGLREQCPIYANAAPLWRFGIGPSILGDRGNPMLTLRTLAIVTIGAGVFAGLPLTRAQACDDDRYPCPIRVPQETADAPAQAAPSAQPQKKASHPARPTAKAQAKPEREAPRAAARAKPSKPAAPEQAADSSAQKGAEAAPALVAAPAMVPPRADQPLNDASRGESPVAAAGTAWPALPATEGAGAGAPAAASANAMEAAKTNAVANAVTNAAQVVDPNEVNDLDRAAAASTPAESSWLTYLLLILATALAAASAFWFFFRSAHPRIRMSNS